MGRHWLAIIFVLRVWLQQVLGKRRTSWRPPVFFSMVEKLEVRHLVVEAENGCAWVDYSLQKGGKQFNCRVAELLTVKNRQIVASTILFDSQSLTIFTSQS